MCVYVQYIWWPSDWLMEQLGTTNPWVWTNPWKLGPVFTVSSQLTLSRVGEDLFRDVELVLCSSGPVLHPSPALHGEVDIAGNCRYRLSLDGYHWTNMIQKTFFFKIYCSQLWVGVTMLILKTQKVNVKMYKWGKAFLQWIWYGLAQLKIKNATNSHLNSLKLCNIYTKECL